jgi:adenosylcobinamide-GDP ribazoletransferase
MSRFLARQARALLLAVQFLTVIPVPGHANSDESLQGLSLLWYPVVGLLLGVLLALSCTVLPLPYSLQAMLTVTLWIVLTGGLHLDGVADCADAWAGGAGDGEKTLRLLKDPLCGSMGVIALIVVIALKYVSLSAVIDAGQLVWLWTVPLLARTSLLCLFLTTRYVRDQGLGAVLAQHFSAGAAKAVLAVIVVAACMLLPLDLSVALLLATLAIFLLVRAAAMRRLGGFTGDVAGAQVELVEVGLLLVLACRSVPA